MKGVFGRIKRRELFPGREEIDQAQDQADGGGDGDGNSDHQHIGIGQRAEEIGERNADEEGA